MSEKFISDLNKARGLGSAKSGHSHWKWQRISAFFLIFLSIWFLTKLTLFFFEPDKTLSKLFYSPLHVLYFAPFINFSLYHGLLGFKVICEDYIRKTTLREIIVLISYCVTIATMGIFTLCLLLNFIINI